MTKPTFSPRPQRLALAVHAAMLALPVMATGAAIFTAPSAAHAQAPAQAMHDFDIPAGPLSTALTRAAAQSGVPLTAAAALTAGKTAPALKGRMTLREALAQLLAGSGLAAGTEGASVVIKAAPPAPGSAKEAVLPVVTVRAGVDTDGSTASGYRVKSASVGALGEKSLKDTPYSIEVYSRELMENKQARSLADLTKADASISLQQDNIVTENNSLTIRGLGPDSATGQKIDGLNARVRANDLPLEHLERVELLKGAGGFLYGFGAPGGTINYVLKRPTDEPVRSLSTQIMDSGLTLIHGDLGGRFGAQDAFGYRVNLVNEEGDTYINDGKSRRHSGSLALDWRITPDLVWRADALVGEHVRKGGYWAVIPNADGAASNWTTATPLDPIDGSRRLAPTFTRYGSRHKTYGTDLAWQFATDWKLSLSHRISENGREFTQPAIFASTNGDYSLRYYDLATRFESRQSQGVISGKFSTGPVVHELVMGASHNVTQSFSGPYQASNLANAGNLGNPADAASPFPGFASYDDANEEFSFMRRRELFVSDTLHLGSDWDLIVGLRRGRLEVKDTAYNRTATTPTLAAVFRPTQGLSLYGSYVESLEEGATAPETAANAYEVFAPLKSKQYEVGAKAEGRDWSATAALFRLQRGLTYTTSDNVFTQDGEARYQGLEISGKFRLSPRWLVTASTMWLDATNQKTEGGALDGKRIQGVAREQTSVYGEYSVAGLPLTLTAGARYVGKRPVDADNQWHVGSVTLLDAGARYETKWGNKPVSLRLSIDNLTNKAYWVTQSESSNLQQGAPRTIKVGAQIEF
ncbi:MULTISPECIES: TonB-dependent siderophore receptor [Betaproteobacteria]|uniref:TonB-dependent siderophore receptor n=1 Tax=Acidovorax facilis TaxID=12917 RepID=A0ABV8D9M2_9BURK|nr:MULTISPECIES: TonB-dependent receptor [Acidovorax]KQB59135.1 hypothetical protein AE621_11945 [Acidovorax sp. SD340]MBO1006751.1 TonB-dependent receptor [Acidovorax sp. SD340]MCO4240258.1 TonB-dependent receptor [Acidovorax facilis]